MQVGMRSEGSFAAGQRRQKVRDASGTTPPNTSLSDLLGPGSSSISSRLHFPPPIYLFWLLFKARPLGLSRLSAVLGSGGWVVPIPLGNQLFCAAERKQDETTFSVQESSCCVPVMFLACLLQCAFLSPLRLSPSKRL